jgi:hypothetical protein
MGDGSKCEHDSSHSQQAVEAQTAEHDSGCSEMTTMFETNQGSSGNSNSIQGSGLLAGREECVELVAAFIDTTQCHSIRLVQQRNRATLQIGAQACARSAVKLQQQADSNNGRMHLRSITRGTKGTRRNKRT